MRADWSGLTTWNMVVEMATEFVMAASSRLALSFATARHTTLVRDKALTVHFHQSVARVLLLQTKSSIPKVVSFKGQDAHKSFARRLHNHPPNL